MHIKSNNIKTMIGSETDEAIDELFESLLHKYQEGLEEAMKGSRFIFDSADLLYNHLQKISLKMIESSYRDSPRIVKK